MFRKLTIALVATAALGTAALSSSAAEAHWRGYGWYGGYGYGHSYWNHPHYGYGYGHALLRLPALLPPALFRREAVPSLLLIARPRLDRGHRRRPPASCRGRGWRHSLRGTQDEHRGD